MLGGEGKRMNWDFVVTLLPQYEKAAWLTLKLATGGILVPLIVGFVCSLVLYYRVTGIEKLVRIYIEVSRNTSLQTYYFKLNLEAG
jgi:polar amino acid transport system permease protein